MKYKVCLLAGLTVVSALAVFLLRPIGQPPVFHHFADGRVLLVPLVVIGVGSVWLWHFTEEWGFGDLRLYYWVQFYPMVVIPVILWLYRSEEGMGMVRPLVWVVVWYVAAKVLEWKDWEVYRMIGVGGHTLKHLAAGVSAGYFVVLFRRRRVGVR